MTDLRQFRAAREVARTFKHPIGERVFTLLEPSPFFCKAWARRWVGRHGREALEAMREMVAQSLQNWERVPVSDLGENAPGGDLPFTTQNLADWLDEQPDLCAELGEVIIDRIKARQEKKDTAAKN